MSFSWIFKPKICYGNFCYHNFDAIVTFRIKNLDTLISSGNPGRNSKRRFRNPIRSRQSSIFVAMFYPDIVLRERTGTARVVWLLGCFMDTSAASKNHTNSAILVFLTQANLCEPTLTLLVLCDPFVSEGGFTQKLLDSSNQRTKLPRVLHQARITRFDGWITA